MDAIKLREIALIKTIRRLEDEAKAARKVGNASEFHRLKGKIKKFKGELKVLEIRRRELKEKTKSLPPSKRKHVLKPLRRGKGTVVWEE